MPKPNLGSSWCPSLGGFKLMPTTQDWRTLPLPSSAPNSPSSKPAQQKSQQPLREIQVNPKLITNTSGRAAEAPEKNRKGTAVPIGEKAKGTSSQTPVASLSSNSTKTASRPITRAKARELQQQQADIQNGVKLNQAGANTPGASRPCTIEFVDLVDEPEEGEYVPPRSSTIPTSGGGHSQCEANANRTGTSHDDALGGSKCASSALKLARPATSQTPAAKHAVRGALQKLSKVELQGNTAQRTRLAKLWDEKHKKKLATVSVAPSKRGSDNSQKNMARLLKGVILSGSSLLSGLPKHTEQNAPASLAEALKAVGQATAATKEPGCTTPFQDIKLGKLPPSESGSPTSVHVQSKEHSPNNLPQAVKRTRTPAQGPKCMTLPQEHWSAQHATGRTSSVSPGSLATTYDDQAARSSLHHAAAGLSVDSLATPAGTSNEPKQSLVQTPAAHQSYPPLPLDTPPCLPPPLPLDTPPMLPKDTPLPMELVGKMGSLTLSGTQHSRSSMYTGDGQNLQPFSQRGDISQSRHLNSTHTPCNGERLDNWQDEAIAGLASLTLQDSRRQATLGGTSRMAAEATGLSSAQPKPINQFAPQAVPFTQVAPPPPPAPVHPQSAPSLDNTHSPAPTTGTTAPNTSTPPFRLIAQDFGHQQAPSSAGSSQCDQQTPPPGASQAPLFAPVAMSLPKLPVPTVPPPTLPLSTTLFPTEPQQSPSVSSPGLSDTPPPAPTASPTASLQTSSEVSPAQLDKPPPPPPPPPAAAVPLPTMLLHQPSNTSHPPASASHSYQASSQPGQYNSHSGYSTSNMHRPAHQANVWSAQHASYQTSYSYSTYNQPAYSQAAHNQATSSQAAYNQATFSQVAHNQANYSHTAHNQTAYSQAARNPASGSQVAFTQASQNHTTQQPRSFPPVIILPPRNAQVAQAATSHSSSAMVTGYAGASLLAPTVSAPATAAMAILPPQQLTVQQLSQSQSYVAQQQQLQPVQVQHVAAQNQLQHSTTFQQQAQTAQSQQFAAQNQSQSNKTFNYVLQQQEQQQLQQRALQNQSQSFQTHNSGLQQQQSQASQLQQVTLHNQAQPTQTYNSAIQQQQQQAQLQQLAQQNQTQHVQAHNSALQQQQQQLQQLAAHNQTQPIQALNSALQQQQQQLPHAQLQQLAQQNQQQPIQTQKSASEQLVVQQQASAPQTKQQVALLSQAQPALQMPSQQPQKQPHDDGLVSALKPSHSWPPSAVDSNKHSKAAFMVFDTNVYLHKLGVVREFAKYALCNSWTVLMPLAVMRELDGLKSNHQYGRLARDASRMVADLNKNSILRLQRHAEMHEFSLDMFKWHLTPALRRILHDLQREMPRALRGDDGILNCLQYFAARSRVVLCSSDRNLFISVNNYEQLEAWSPEELHYRMKDDCMGGGAQKKVPQPTPVAKQVAGT